ncbi:MAG: HupE/UreJ family protein [Bryobacterales bacterium]|nr:HupE/UreJ family protein [Bryobacterales bacterium]
MPAPRLLFALLSCALPLAAHVISMSSGDFRIEANRATYELRVPIYEIQHTAAPEKMLFDNIRFTGGGGPAKLVEKSCVEDKADASFRCKARYEFPAPVDRLDVVCTFHSVTVPNHVHLLRAYLADKTDQAVFDFSTPKATIRFRPPTPLETFVTAAGAGFARAYSSGAAVLFLACLALAARRNSELALIAASFLLGEIAAAIVVPIAEWNPAPRFVEAALALTVAYLAVEILTLPHAGQRWLVAAVLGLFHGLSYALYLTSTGYHPLPVLLGMAVAELLAIAVFAMLMARMGRVFSSIAPLASRIAACFLLLTGIGWFFLRLRA